MILRPPRSTRTDTLFPYTTLFRSIVMLGIVMKDDEGLHAGDIAELRPGLPGRMTPALAAGILLIGKHAIVDHDIGAPDEFDDLLVVAFGGDRKSTRLNSSH